MDLKFKIIYIFIAVVLIFQCSNVVQNKDIELSQAVYDYRVPTGSKVPYFKTLLRSIIVMNSSANYRTIFFEPESKIIRSNIATIDTNNDNAQSIKYDNVSAYGTGTIIYNYNKHIAILSSAHIFNHPDTLVTYFDSGNGEKFVSSISIKQSEKHYSSDMPEYKTLNILAQDPQNDIIVLGLELQDDEQYLVPAIPYPFGDSSKLEWGTLVYLAGYPKGYKMLTQGMISEPDRNNRRNFLIDTMFNYGFSGGLIVGVKQGVPNFEILGIATSATADLYNVLVPDPASGHYDNNTLYQQDIYNRHVRFLNYGITIATPVNAILEMLKDNKMIFFDNGYDMELLLRKAE